MKIVMTYNFSFTYFAFFKHWAMNICFDKFMCCGQVQRLVYGIIVSFKIWLNADTLPIFIDYSV